MKGHPERSRRIYILVIVSVYTQQISTTFYLFAQKIRNLRFTVDFFASVKNLFGFLTGFNKDKPY